MGFFMLQLDLFPQDENDIIRLEINKIRESSDKVRRALFARHGELAKLYLDVNDRLSIIERHICRGEQ